MDQAQKLRDIVKDVREEAVNSTYTKDSHVITVSSGKGGVGKTNFTVNLGIALSKQGKRVTIIDADLGLANVDVILGIIPKYTLSHIVKNEKSIEEIMIEGPYGLKVISGGSGMLDLVNLREDQIESLIHSFDKLNEISDYILIDTGAGLSKSVLSFIKAASDVVVVITPDPTSITDAYALIKNISEEEKHINLVINRVESSKEGAEVFGKLERAAKKFLEIKLNNLGYVYEDNNVKKSVRSQRPFCLEYPNSIATKGIELIAYNLVNKENKAASVNKFSLFINKLFR
ncbi:MAG: MinD/ParA family protein [Clostridia bacterium]|nr:MinD/ParA family protein [Clostridia bacterium]